MPKPKPFLTYDQQIDKLTNEKHIIINDEPSVRIALKRIGYFSIIGGYKTPFINPMTRIYENDASFNDVQALYYFDRELRNIFFRYLCEVEVFMRQLISYNFCFRHGELQTQYLNKNNYDISSPAKKAAVDKLIKTLTYQANVDTKHSYLVHQRKRYNNVPLWVAMNALTFGQISKFYSLLKIKMKEDIAQEFPNLSTDVLETYLDRLCLIRNTCAHNERLYSFRFDKDFPDTDIHKQLHIPQKGEQYLYGKNDVFSSLIALRYLLPTESFSKFISELSGCIDTYLKNTDHMTRKKLYAYMGFPSNWQDVSLCTP